jgi:hypothetical protein
MHSVNTSLLYDFSDELEIMEMSLDWDAVIHANMAIWQLAILRLAYRYV